MSMTPDIVEWLEEGPITATETVANGQDILEVYITQSVSVIETTVPEALELTDLGPMPSFSGGGGGGGGSVAWGDLTGVPATFTPSVHTHDDRYYTETESDARFAPLSHTHASTQITDFTEAVQDAVAALLAAGSNVTVNYNDAANTLTIGSTAGGLDAEAVRDTIGVAIGGVGNITVSVNDAADTITISTTATQNSTDAALRDRSTHTGTQAQSTIVNLAADLAAKFGYINNTVNLTNPTTMSFADINITDDGSDSSLWPERLRFLFNGKLTSRFNEYGELRMSSGKPNTVAFRMFCKETDAEADHSTTVPIAELVKSRQTRTMRWQLMSDGSTQQAGRPTWNVEGGPTLQGAYLKLNTGDPLPAGTPSNILVVRG